MRRISSAPLKTAQARGKEDSYLEQTHFPQQWYDLPRELLVALRFFFAG